MTPELHRQFKNFSPYGMIQELKYMFEKQARVERFDLIQTFYDCKQEERKSVSSYVLKMKGYVEQLKLLNYNIHNMRKVIGELHALLIKYEKGLPKKAATPQVLAIQENLTKDGAYHHCKEVGYWKRNYLVYLAELMKKKKKQVGTARSSGVVELEEIQDEDTSPSKKTSKIPTEVEGFKPPQEDEAPVRRSRSNKWIDAMNAEMQSMKDNQIRRLVDLPPNAKGYTKTYEVDNEETFSLVADIRAIRILIAVAAFYDYELWKINVKTVFLNGYLDEDIYMVQPEGFVDPNHPRKNPGEPHWTAVKTILKYLRNPKDMFMVYDGNSEVELRVTCYCDAGFETDRHDIKSQTGYVFVLNKGAVDWKSSKQSTTTMSAT
uniref:Reverse transcriptase Ty1/copia-type domain-containing protein n=1 Tax=Tanacetum cinerariifolium TaxID=118510 RepID=A0A699IJ83_TANCI|nr:hypothetical protein [Tanacetum cinerariifolium]